MKVIRMAPRRRGKRGGPPAQLLILLVTALLLSSCEELLFEEVPDEGPVSIFEQTWTFVDEEYSFFEFKGIDWDATYETYRPQVNNDMDEEELFSLLADMLYILRDGHVNLKSDFNRSRNWQWFLSAPPNYDYSVLERYYFTDGGEDTVGRSVQQLVGDAFILMDFAGPAAGTTDDVGYIHYRSFGNPVREKDMDYVIRRFSDHAGLIIDVRDNGGGQVGNAFTIANRLVDTKTAVARERIKIGPGHDEFSSLETIHLEPPEDKPTYTNRPVVVLTNQMSYSATNYLATMVAAVDNVTLMGRPTGGGGGTPAFTVLTNGWELRVSTTQLFTLAGDNVEDGVAPDYPLESTEAELAVGTDTILETAREYLRGNWP